MSKQTITDNSPDNPLSREALEARLIDAANRLADHFDIPLDAIPDLLYSHEPGSFQEMLEQVRKVPLMGLISFTEFLEGYAVGVAKSNATLYEPEALAYRLLAAINKLAAALNITPDEVLQGVGPRAKHSLTFNDVRSALVKDDFRPMMPQLVLRYEGLVEKIEASGDFMKDPANVVQLFDNLPLFDYEIAAVTSRPSRRKGRGKDKKQRPVRLSTRVTAGAILNAATAVNSNPEDGAYFLIHTSDIIGPLSPRALAYSLKALHARGAIIRHRLDAASRAQTIAELPDDMQTYLNATRLHGRVLLQVFPSRLQSIAALKPYPNRSSATK